ncbi:MAG: nitroreductase family protein [Syntrophaceae bacterium]
MGVISSVGPVAATPVIDHATCTACKLCVRICASNSLAMDADNRVMVLPDGTPDSFGCIGCGHCMLVCPTGSITVTGRKLKQGDTVSLPPAEECATAEALEALFLQRRSIRDFAKKEVPRELIERVVEAASSAPMGIPPWEVGLVVFHGRDKVRELSADVTALYRGMLKLLGRPLVMKLIRPFVKKSTYAQMQSFIIPLAEIITNARDRGEDYMLYDAPAALLFHTSPYADAADAFIACTYAMLAAESLGLGTCMIGCLTPPLAHKPSLMRKYQIPAGHKPAIVLILGYPGVKFQRAVRRSFHSVMYYERAS